MRRLLVVPVLALACAPAAHAATVSVGERQDFPAAPVFGVVHFDAQPGERNALTWTFPTGKSIQLHDAGAPITVGSGCTAVDANTAVCSTDKLTWSVDARLGDGDDTGAPASDEGIARAATVQLHGGDGADVLRGGNGYTSLAGDGGDDQLETGVAYGGADGGAGNDTLSGNGALAGGAGNDRLTGGAGSGQLDGGAGDDVVDGGDGSDGVSGGGGHDIVRGGAGNDSVSDGDGRALPITFPLPSTGPQTRPVDADTLDGGPGEDALEYGLRSRAVTADLRTTTAGPAGERDRISGFENVNGGAGADHLTGDNGPNRISGGSGHDVIRTAGGDDVVFATWAADISLGAGDDELTLSSYVRGSTQSHGSVDCGTGTDSTRYPNPRVRTPRSCETLGLRLWALVHSPESTRPAVQCGPFRRRPVTTPCTFRLRMLLPQQRGERYLTGGTPLGTTAWRAVPVGSRRTFPLHLGPWGRARLRACGTLPVRVVLERRTASRPHGYAVGSWVMIMH